MNAWTEWYNLDEPSGDGDLELFGLFEYGCKNASVTQVESVDGIPFNETNQVVHIGDSYGFICLNFENNNPCLDYKVRQCCHINCKNF